MNVEKQAAELDIFALERPNSRLFTYYILSSFLMGPLFFIPLIPLFFRYHTLRYRFDEEGIAMRWGILFRKEITLTYARIQDIHLQSNFVERWLGLARIQIQTASGSAKAEMTIEGIPEFEVIRISGDIYLDEMVIDTYCVPEPASMSLLCLGALALIHKRK